MCADCFGCFIAMKILPIGFGFWLSCANLSLSLVSFWFLGAGVCCHKLFCCSKNHKSVEGTELVSVLASVFANSYFSPFSFSAAGRK